MSSFYQDNDNLLLDLFLNNTDIILSDVLGTMIGVSEYVVGSIVTETPIDPVGLYTAAVTQGSSESLVATGFMIEDAFSLFFCALDAYIWPQNCSLIDSLCEQTNVC